MSPRATLPARTALAKAGKTDADIDWLIPHQANIRIMEGTAKKLKLPREKLIVTVNELSLIHI